MSHASDFYSPARAADDYRDENRGWRKSLVLLQNLRQTLSIIEEAGGRPARVSLSAPDWWLPVEGMGAPAVSAEMRRPCSPKSSYVRGPRCQSLAEQRAARVSLGEAMADMQEKPYTAERMKLEERQDALLVVTREQVTTIYETRVQRTTTYAVEIDHPLENGEKVPFSEGDPLLLVIEEKDGERFFFDTICLGLDNPGSPALTLLFLNDFLKLPGRKLLRVIVNVPVRVTPLEAPNSETFSTQSVNISSGGVLISSPYNLPERAQVTMELSLSKKDEPLKVHALRKRTEHPEGTGKKTFLLAFEFVQVDEKARSRLSDFMQRHCIKTYQRKRSVD